MDGHFLTATRSGFQWLNLDSFAFTPIAHPEVDRPGNRFNDGKRAPDGSFWAGTMDDAEKDEHAGCWYRLDPEDGVVTQLDCGYHVTNGPAFSPDGKRVYLTDSARQIIYVADLLGNGTRMANKRVWKTFKPEDGYPDGMTFDDQGRLWVAFWDGHAVKGFAEDGYIVADIPVPVARPTAPAFDATRRVLYVTSAALGQSCDGLAGGLYRVAL